MPTKKPRIIVTLERQEHELLVRVAAQQGRSVSSLVGELVRAVSPSYERVAVLMDQASRANDDVLAGVVSAVDRAEGVISALLAPSAAQHDLFERARAKITQVELQAQERRLTRRRIDETVEDAIRSRGRRASSDAFVNEQSQSRRRANAEALPSPRRGKSDPRPVITGVRSSHRTGSRRGSGSVLPFKKKALK